MALRGRIISKVSAAYSDHVIRPYPGSTCSPKCINTASSQVPYGIYEWESIGEVSLQQTSRTDGFSHTKTVVGWCDTKTKPKGYPSIHETTRIFFGGGNQTWCTCCIGNFGGISLKNSFMEFMRWWQRSFNPKLGEENHPSWLRRNIFFRWVGKKHPPN